MSFHLDDVRVDPAKLRGVVWDFHTKMPTPDNQPHAEHFCMRIVPKGPAFHAAHAQALEAFASESRRGKVPPDVFDRIVGEVHARVTLVEWWNLLAGSPPVPLLHSYETALDLLTNPKWLVIRRFVDSAFANESALLDRQEQEATGN